MDKHAQGLPQPWGEETTRQESDRAGLNPKANRIRDAGAAAGLNDSSH